MTIQNMVFTPTDGLRNVSTYPTDPVSEAALRDTVQQGMDQLRDYINNSLIPKVTDKTGDTMTGPLTLSADPTNALHAATKQYIDNKMAAPAWVAPTLVSSWVNYGAPTQAVGYYKDNAGIVHLRGTIKSGTINTTAFTLPIGYRIVGGTQAYAASSGGSFAEVIVNTDGTVVPSAGANTGVRLDGITFRAEQ